MDENREIWVGLPDNYNETATYPTLYVLDAEWHFENTLAIVKELSSHGRIPDHIVVGIPQINEKHRFEDMTFGGSRVNGDGVEANSFYMELYKTGGGGAFLDYLTTEAVPLVDSLYAANGFHILQGHSLGGYFAAYSIPHQDVFQAYQIYDASIWYDAGEAYKICRSKLDFRNKSNVYISSASDNGSQGRYFLDMIDSLSAVMERHPGIEVRSKRFEYENHSSMFMVSVIDGMNFLYQGFDFGFIAPSRKVTANEYIQHYNAFSTRLNYPFKPNPEGFRWIGYVNYAQKNWEEAIRAYKLAMTKYDSDAEVLIEMGETFEQLHNPTASLECYEKAKSLAPRRRELNTYIKRVKMAIKKQEERQQN